MALIRAERARQVAVEGYTPEHDARLVNGELTAAAAHYIHAAGWPSGLPAAQPGDEAHALDAAMDRAVNAEHAIGQVIQVILSRAMTGRPVDPAELKRLLVGDILRPWAGLPEERGGEGDGHG